MLLKLIHGSFYFPENKQEVFLSHAHSTDILPSNAIVVHSPVIFSQLNGLRSLSLDYIYFLFADLKLFTFDQQKIDLEKIFKTVGGGLLELDLDESNNCMKHNHSKDITKINLPKLIADIITLAGEYCPNLVTLKLPTERFNDIHEVSLENDGSDLVATVISENLKKWKKLSDLEFPIYYKVTCWLPDSIIHASIYSHDNETNLKLELPFNKYPNLQSFRMVDCIDDNLLVELAKKCPNLTSVIADLDFEEAIKVDKGVIALIEKCRSLTCVELREIIISSEVMKAFLASNLQLRTVLFEIGYAWDEESRDSNLLRAFFKKFPTIESFNGGVYTSDHHFEVLLEFVTNNRYLKNFHVTFGTSVNPALSKISVDQLTDFVIKSSHINSVVIDLENFVNFPHDHFAQLINKYPNVTRRLVNVLL